MNMKAICVVMNSNEKIRAHSELTSQLGALMLVLNKLVKWIYENHISSVGHCAGIEEVMGSNPVYILARLVEYCTGIAKFMDSNPNFSSFVFTTC